MHEAEGGRPVTWWRVERSEEGGGDAVVWSADDKRR